VVLELRLPSWPSFYHPQTHSQTEEPQKQPKHVPCKIPTMSNQRSGTTMPPPHTPLPITAVQHGHPVPIDATMPLASSHNSPSATEHAHIVSLHTTVPPLPNPKTTIPHSKAIMSTSLTPEEVAEQALREKAKLVAQVKYLRSQFGQMMQEKISNLRSSRSTSKQVDSDGSDVEESNSLGDFDEDVYTRRSRRHHRPHD